LPASSPSDDPLRVCLDRRIELDNVRLRVRDWPGRAGPLVHVPDPLFLTDSLVDGLAAALAPRYRVLSVSSRGDAPYQVDVVDLVGVLSQFGFRTPVLVGERLGCVAALVAAAWYPDRVAGLILVDPVHDPPRSETVAARVLRDCPPDWSRLHAAVRCPILESAGPRDIEAFLTAQVL
jgi:pimeloyl-ACP methyl ester carboxylesterase